MDDDIVFAGDMPSQTVSDMVRRGDRRPLARGMALELFAAMSRHRVLIMILDRCAADVPELAGWFGDDRRLVALTDKAVDHALRRPVPHPASHTSSPSTGPIASRSNSCSTPLAHLPQGRSNQLS